MRIVAAESCYNLRDHRVTAGRVVAACRAHSREGAVLGRATVSWAVATGLHGTVPAGRMALCPRAASPLWPGHGMLLFGRELGQSGRI
jgi:hypothetical protein